jgi:AcrR family transcriptional regulator
VSEATTLEPRRLPTAGRAAQTVDRILEATAELLDEIGFDAITTNRIAERAQVNVASLYKYFPNKYAVLKALADKVRDEQLDLLADELTGPQGDGADWRGQLGGLLDAYFALFLSRPGFAELAAVLSSSAPLREIDEASLAAEAGVIAERLVDYGITGSRNDHDAMARVMLEAARGVFPLARRAGPAERKRLMGELKQMLSAYLAVHIEG